MFAQKSETSPHPTGTPWRLTERRLLSVWLPQMTQGADPAAALTQAPYTRRRGTQDRRKVSAEPSTQQARRPLDRLARWCDRYTPLVAPDGEQGRYQGLFLDITGCGHLFGGDEALVDDLRNRLDAFGLVPFIAGAHTAGAAWALARFGGKSQPRPLTARNDLAGALSPLPVQALRLSPAAAEGLDRVGLRRIGDLLDKPRAPLTTRFGPEVALRLDQALGRADETLACGYRRARQLNRPSQLAEALTGEGGPALFQISVLPESGSRPPRPELDPRRLARRFRGLHR